MADVRRVARDSANISLKYMFVSTIACVCKEKECVPLDDTEDHAVLLHPFIAQHRPNRSRDDVQRHLAPAFWMLDPYARTSADEGADEHNAVRPVDEVVGYPPGGEEEGKETRDESVEGAYGEVEGGYEGGEEG